MVLLKTVGKFLIIGVLVFILINTSSLGLYQDKSSGNSRQQEPIPNIFGLMGKNEWYISDVTIFFDYDHKEVDQIQYYYDNSWHIYTGPFHETEDGIYKIPWFWIDREGNNHSVVDPIYFKIDLTPPTIQLTKKSGIFKVTFTAIANDETSQIECVEFYLDGVLQKNDTELPYKYSYNGGGKSWVYAICYNYAGFFMKSDNLSTPRPNFRNHNLMDIVFALMQKIFFQFY